MIEASKTRLTVSRALESSPTSASSVEAQARQHSVVNAWAARALIAASALALCAAGTPSIEPIGRTRGAIVLPEGPPAGSVILIPGGTNLQTIRADGGASSSGNYVMRIRRQFVEAGFAIVYLEDPGDLRAAIARMRRIARPLFLVGTSTGTIVAARNAAVLGTDGPDGLVLTSTLTKPSRLRPEPVHDVYVRRIAVPVLVVHTLHDACPSSPAAGIAPLAARFAKTTEVVQIVVSSDTTDGDECGPFAPHGYAGIETEVAGRIVTWMRAHRQEAPGP